MLQPFCNLWEDSTGDICDCTEFIGAKEKEDFISIDLFSHGAGV
jgi:hypothetical protein